MTRATLRRTSTATVLLLTLGAAAACGGDGNDEGNGDPVGSSPAEAAAGEELDTDEFIAFYRRAYEKATTAHVTTTLEGQISLTMEGDVDFGTTPPAVQVTLEGAGTPGAGEVILVDNVMYVSDGQGGYLESDLDDPNNPLASSGLTEQLDPEQLAGILDDGLESVTAEGPTDVDGETFDQYSLILDGTALLEAFGDEVQETLPDDALPDELAYDLYLDDDGLIRLVEADLGDSLGSIRTTYDDWGDKVDIQAPPASKVKAFPAP